MLTPPRHLYPGAESAESPLQYSQSRQHPLLHPAPPLEHPYDIPETPTNTVIKKFTVSGALAHEPEFKFSNVFWRTK